ncbi:MAG: polysaccharide deacetylase family protein [Armatimonadetes bacterium]|nr:polysaccharide deacetylase family protein [Armatimonadota bacterium]
MRTAYPEHRFAQDMPAFVARSRRTTDARTFQPVWPHGARCAATFTLHFDAQTLWRSMEQETLPNISLGEFGARVGIWRFLDLMARHDIRMTVFVPGWVAETYPDAIRAVAERGHELAYHGYHHVRADSGWDGSSWDAAREEAVMDHTISVLERLGGQRVIGYCSRLTPHTMDLLLRKGFRYCNNHMADDIPYWWMDDQGRPTGLLELPFDWVMTDSSYYFHTYLPFAGDLRSPEEARQVWQAEFDGAYAFGRYFLLVNHPQLSGRASRILGLERLVEYVKSKKDVWIAAAGEVADYWRATYPPASGHASR